MSLYNWAWNHNQSNTQHYTTVVNFCHTPIPIPRRAQCKVLARDLKSYSCTKATKCVFIHCLLLYNQAFSFNRMRLEQIFTFSTDNIISRSESTCYLTFLSWHAHHCLIITVFMKYHKKGKLWNPQGNFGFFNPLPLLALHCLPCLLCAVLECRWVCMHVIVSSCYVISNLFERD